MQVPGVDYTESFLSVATDTSTQILIGITFFREEEVWASEIFYVEAEFIHTYMPV